MNMKCNTDLPPLAVLPLPFCCCCCCCCLVLRSGLLGGAACFLYCPVYFADGLLEAFEAAFLFTWKDGNA